MNEIESTQSTGNGFAGYQISPEPVVQTRRAVGTNGATVAAAAESWRAFETDSLAVLPRDPTTLFVYWDLEVSKHLTGAGLDHGKVLLRVLRVDGGEEMTNEVDPLLGYAFAEVSSPAVRYTCELGCLDGSAWRTLVRSEEAETPATAMSADENADFVTLPFHLSFQRLIDIFRASSNSQKTLTELIANMQRKGRELRASMSADEWSQLVATVETESGLGLTGVQPNELASLLRTVEGDAARQIPSPATRARWRQLGENLGGSSGEASWGGESSR